MDVTNLITLFCGVSLFLFGMSLMGDGLKKAAGKQLELLLYKLTNTTWKGILLGTAVTGVIQSSSATSVMVVGFVNSGMMKFRQSIGIILGAVLGTSVTGWVIALSELGGGGGWLSLLSTASLTGIMAVIGILLRSFSKHQSHRNTGNILLGFAVLMVGMSQMSGAVEPLKDSASFVRLLTAFSNPFLGIAAGAAFTAILQSASAAVGIVQALTVTGAIDFETALPLIMGISIGASVPVLLAGLSAKTDGRRTAFVYLLICVTAAAVVSVVFYTANAVFRFPFMSVSMTAVSVALLNTVYRLTVVLCLWPLAGVMEKAVCRLVPEKEPVQPRAELKMVPLEERFLTFPSMYLAILQCRTAISDMARATEESVEGSISALREYTDDKLGRVQELETLTDRYEDHIGTYLLRITRKALNRMENNNVSRYLHTLSDFERITDHAMDIAYIARELHETGLSYHEDAWKELSVLEEAVQENVRLTVQAFSADNLDLARRVEPLSEVVDELCDQLKRHHIQRLEEGKCTMERGLSYNDLLTGCREISDHCTKIARAMLELDEENALNSHARSRHSEPDQTALEEYREQYTV